MDEVLAFAGRHGLKVIEDAAQTVGVFYRDTHCGTLGDVGCFSFFADKSITTAEGGYVVTRHPEIYERLRLLRNQGRLNRGSFVHPAIGFNFRITDLQAALGLVQLAKLDAIRERKLHNLVRYEEELEAVEQVSLLPLTDGSTYIPFRAVVLAERAQELMAFLESRGVQPRSFFYPLHKQPCFQYLDRRGGGPQDLDDSRFPNALRGFEDGVCLPIHPTLTADQISYVCQAIRDFYAP